MPDQKWEDRGVNYASAAIRHLERRVRRLEALLAKTTDRPGTAEVRKEMTGGTREQ